MTRYCARIKRAYISEQTSNGKSQSNTASKLSRTRGLIPFKKGDPRINRNGRPKSFDEVRALAQQVAHEGANTIKILRILRDWAGSDDVTKQRAFVEYAFGKVPDKLETTGLENKTTLVLHFDHERGVTNGSAPIESDQRA